MAAARWMGLQEPPWPEMEQRFRGGAIKNNRPSVAIVDVRMSSQAMGRPAEHAS